MDENIQYLPNHSIDDLIELALVQMDLEEIPCDSDALSILRAYCDPIEVFSTVQRLRTSEHPKERMLFAFILAQLDAPQLSFLEQSLAALFEMVQHETHSDVLHAVCIALGHLKDPRAIEPLVRLKNHPHEAVRYGVAFSLSGFEDLAAANALIELSRDTDYMVRDWATFGLSVLTNLDTPEIREALLARVTDEDYVVRGQSLVGLAERKDRRVIEAVQAELSGEFHGDWAVEAAELLADPSLYPPLQSLWDRLGPKDKSAFESSFREALVACAPRY
ncbi:MAG: HEAT repeat domain-containing protein [Chloroflexi bacterium]|nr:HEAT repeat domain-containing protein [Chloroflexota bacterium]